MSKKNRPKWLSKPEDHDYPAAESYLKLVFENRKAEGLVDSLKKADMSHFKAKDIFRASGLSLLGVSNHHVKKNIKKIGKGEALSPILLVRNATTSKVVIADGYHRLCAMYHFDEDQEVPCKIV